MGRPNMPRIKPRKLPLVFISVVAGLVILSWGAASCRLALIGWHPKSMYIRKKAIENWAFIRDMAFYLIELAAGWFGVSQLVWRRGILFIPHYMNGLHESCGGMIHYYTIVSVDVKGLNTKIPNLLKESEQTFVGFHMSDGSLSIFAAELSWVAQWTWRLVVLCRHEVSGYQLRDGLLCLLWLFNKKSSASGKWTSCFIWHYH